MELKVNSKSVNEIETEKLGVVRELFANSLYIGTHRTPYFTTGNNRMYNMRNGNNFVTEWRNWSTGDNARRRKKMQKLVSELQRILGFEELSISSNNETDNLMINNEYGSFRLDELGSGISHVVISLANAIFYNPSFILIDEPENSLHPKLQESFVRALSLKCKKGLLATTHSIGLARTMGDSIYTLTKRVGQEKNKYDLSDFKYSSQGDISQLVIELGYTKYLNLGGKNILLVEGRTDIKVFKELLAKIGIENEVIVMDLGGAEYITDKKERIVVELKEIKRLSADSYTIILDSDLESDMDKLSDQKIEFSKICTGLGINVFYTDYRATENYITQKSLDVIYQWCATIYLDYDKNR